MLQTKEKVNLLKQAIDAAELTLKNSALPVCVEVNHEKIVIQTVGSDHIAYLLTIVYENDNEAVATITAARAKPFFICKIKTEDFLTWTKTLEIFLKSAKTLYSNLKLVLKMQELMKNIKNKLKSHG
jgi:hypothetical protein